MRKYISIFALAVVLTSCKFCKNDWVDFSAGQSLDEKCFKPYCIQTRELSSEIPADSYLPGGETFSEHEATMTAEEVQSLSEAVPGLKTTSTSMTNVIQNLLDYGNHNKVIAISGTYKSHDQNNVEITLSGKVLLPSSGTIKNIILVSHYTIGSNAEAPSNCFPMEGVICPLGYAMIFPDYIGYGVTANKIHPYLAMDLTAENVLDMYLAVCPYLKAINREPVNNDIYLMGYSQGGATTMAVQRLIELGYADIKIKRVFAGGGPYDIKATYESYVTTGTASYPCAVPYVIQGMNESERIDLNVKALLDKRIADNLDEWFNSKKYTTAQINKLIGTKDAHKILSELGCDRTSKEVATLYKAMANNSIVGVYDWQPEAPVYMVHSMDDETVPYLNAQRAKSAWEESNIQFNFGKYGSHVNTALRFIFIVKGILKNE